jgi:two-component system phosphate regulon sensor histidine kinase PhoR
VRIRLFWKIFAAATTLVILSSLLGLWLASGRISEDARAETRRFLESKLGLVEALARPALEGGTQDELAAVFAGRRGDLARYTVIDAKGEVLADSERDPSTMENHAARPEVAAARQADSGYASRFSHTLGRDMVYAARRVEGDGRTLGFVRAAIPEIDARILWERLLASLLRAALIATGIALLLAWFLARRIVQPVRVLTGAAQSIAAGEYERPIPSSSKDEIGELSTAFRRMAGELNRRIQALDSERQELGTILSGMVEGVLAIDAGTAIAQINSAAAQILGVDPIAVKGKTIWEAIPHRALAAIAARTVETGVAEESEIQLPGRAAARFLSIHSSPLRAGDGHTVGAVLVLHDVTKLRQLETVRRDFVANASHELKTPVAAIRGLVETILEDEDMPVETQRGFLVRVRAQTERLTVLIEELLLLSRLEAAPTLSDGGVQDLREAVRQAIEAVGPIARERQVEIAVAMPDQAVRVPGSAEALRRIVGNLLDNAVKYTNPRTTVDVSVTEGATGSRLVVADAGRGIPGGEEQRIFERFYRVDPGRSRAVGGTGLGLAIVKHLAQAMGAEVAVSAAVGGGAAFSVTFPLPAAAQPS